MLRSAATFAATLALLLSAPAYAWGAFGHETVAKIAWKNISPATRKAIKRLLKHQDLLGTPECAARTIEQASVWADCIKGIKGPDGKPKFQYAYNWHFQDVEICQPFDPAPACKDGNCVSAQIERDVALLRDPASDDAARVQALAFLIHFVGDLHQPLHAGEKADKGGNDVKVDYGALTGDRLNLHTVWDSLLAERAITTGPSLVRRYSQTEREAMQAGSVADWSRESWQAAQDVVYAGALGGDACRPTPAHVSLSEDTIRGWIAPARLQVERGGLRLAKELDEAFGA